MKTIIFIFAALFTLPTAASAVRIAPLPAGVRTFHDEFYVSAAPNKEMIEAMHAIGARVAIDLRKEAEPHGSEAALLKKNEFTYFSTPISRDGPLLRAEVSRFETVLSRNKANKPWIFCGTGNRAGALLTVYLFRQGKISREELGESAKSLGVSSPEMRDKIQTYVEENGSR